MLQHESDEALVARAKAGNQPAYRALVERYQTPLYRYLAHFVGDDELALDLTQDTFVAAYRALNDTREELHFKAWLYRIATNKAISAIRRRKIVQFVPLLARSTPQPVGGHPEDRLGETEIVDRTLQKMPTDLATPLLLYGMQGFSYEEIAQMLGISLSAVKMRIHRGRQSFKEIYEKLSE